MEQRSSADQALIAAVVQRDEAALKALYERYGALIFTLALRKLQNDRGLAEEVLQDVFLRCWQQAHTYRAEAGAVSAWLFGIARNRAIDLHRSRQQQAREREVAFPDDAPIRDAGSYGGPSPSHDGSGGRRLPPALTAGDESERVALQVTMQAALDELSAAQRQALTLAYYGDLSQTEIARQLGEPLGTVKTRMRAGLEQLRRRLQPGLHADRPAEAGSGRD